VKIAVIGAGDFGSRLARRLVEAGHLVSLSEADSAQERLHAVVAATGAMAAPATEAVASADVVVLAVPFSAIDDVLTPQFVTAAAGKTVVDVTNPLGPDRMSLTLGHTTSAAEQIAAKLPNSHVVKAFNTLLAPTLTTPAIGGARLMVPVAGDDAAKRSVLDLAASLGFDAFDAGPLDHARYLEPMIVPLLRLTKTTGTSIGLALLRG
jgi:predicted dinucleotide-binding enzyme